ncbi:MAG: FAD-binding oxidoreductase [Wenzhouxiangellaceae bacterium]
MRRELIDALTAVVGAGYVQLGGEIEPRFLEEPRRRWRKQPALLVRPASTAETAAVITLCAQHGLPVIPRGGGTGTVGGASASADGRECMLSLDRMSAIRGIDTDAASMTLEAGAVLDRARREANAHGLDIPISLASGGSATLGGIIASNAGGHTTLRHGNARQMLLGVEAVLADGRVLNLLSSLRKDNTGYDLVGLLAGSEGTLAVITALTLALVPLPNERFTAWCALDSPADALALLRHCRAGMGETLSAFELIPRRALELVLAHLPDARDPLDRPAPWYVLVEADSTLAGDHLSGACQAVLSRALESGLAAEVAVARSEAQRHALWRLRESIHAAQRQAGASIKHDISLPIAALPEMIAGTLAQLQQEVPGIRPCVFGHVGDGNLHFNLSRPANWSDEAFMAEEARINRIVFDRVLALGGSIAAEHGIGQLRVAELARRADPVKLDLLRRIKHALDPDNLLNPGKLIVPKPKVG